MKRIALLIAAGLLLPGCSLFLPVPDSSAPTVARTEPSLTGTDWKLVQLHGSAVRYSELQPEARIQLEENRQQLRGSGGCNRIAGSYVQTGTDGIRLEALATTRMACAAGMETEQGLLKAFGQAAHWRIEAEHLQLLDDKGTVVAIFRATTTR